MSLYDWLEEDPKFRRMGEEKYREGLAAGFIEGKAEGLAKAKAEALAELRGNILKILRVRFPRLVGETWNAIDEIDSIKTLTQLLMKFAVAPDEDAARRVLEAHIQQQ